MRTVAAVLPLACLLSIAVAQDPAIATTGLKPYTYQGCFSSSKPLSDQGSWTYQSPGYCQGLCVKLQKAVMGTTSGSNCFCGDLLPVANSKVSDSKCNTPCFGYDKDNCGGSNLWSVYLTGTKNAVGNVQGSSGSSSSDSDSSSSTSSSAATTSTPKPKAAVPSDPSTTSDAPATIVTKGTTIIVTAPGQTTAKATAAVSTEKTSKGANTAGIAAGVVVGVAVICGIAGGLFFFLRRRKQRAEQADHSRHHENPFNTNNLPSSAASMSDSRLEPSVMMQRRQSDGSIADNQDYSRRILTVTNPDSRL
ncbi:MAG: hypothetical protein HETSPECPRED_004212 [Heterodermia speciosa]|uniref:WSC domain-containing protein n=1 Tax=Heterodermia speciosa TaxID=116794 RepID=A0A8H3I9U5_9LECA|nr:MAG: hypothetical protein HETSPECPRED_004212 [Heterodermia speciosa]